MSRTFPKLGWGATVLGLSILTAWNADAASRRASPHARTKAKVAAKAGAPKEEVISVAGAKVAMFDFSGDDVEPIRRQVQHVFRSKGLKINTALRPVDSAEQYREMAVALNLAAYIDGEVTIDGTAGSATIFVRSGTTGLRIASATFSGDRHLLPADVGKALWDQVGPALGRACADAAKPRKPEHEPMRINAGTPLSNNPTETD